MCKGEKLDLLCKQGPACSSCILKIKATTFSFTFFLTVQRPDDNFLSPQLEGEGVNFPLK